MVAAKGRTGTGNRKSIEELKLTGQYREDRHGGYEVGPEDAVQVQPEGHVIGKYSPHKKTLHQRFSKLLFEKRLTNEDDALIVSQLVELYSAYIQVVELIDQEGIQAKVGSKLAIYAGLDLAKEIRVLLAEFRLTPSTRGLELRTKGAKGKEVDPIEDFLKNQQKPN